MNQKIVLTRQIVVAVFLMFSAATFVSCEKYAYDPPTIDPNAVVSFQNDLVPIFSNCTGCHGGALSPDLRADKAYESLKNGGLINTSNPESSRLYVKIISSSHASRTTDIEKQKILAWITQGALKN